MKDHAPIGFEYRLRRSSDPLQTIGVSLYHGRSRGAPQDMDMTEMRSGQMSGLKK